MQLRYNFAMARRVGSLRKRIVLIIVMGISIILLSLGVVSHLIIQKNIDDSLNKKLALSRLVRNNVDNLLKDNINRLYDISLSGAVDLNDSNLRRAKEAVKTAYRYSVFTDGICLLDKNGTTLLTYPERIRENSLNVLGIEPVNRMLSLGKPVVSNLYIVEPTKKPVLYVLVPLRDKNGSIVGAAGGQIDPTNPLLLQRLGLINIGRNEFIDIVDANGVVLASSNPSRMFTSNNRNNFFTTVINRREERVATCHVCHQSAGRSMKSTTILAFVPLETAPWGIAIQEPKRDVFASSVELKKTFVVLGVIFMGTALILTIGINRSIVDPLKHLIRSADRIAKGDLSKPVTPEGSDEIGVLSRSFETMRTKLVESLESITRHNADLENRVEVRTQQIKESQKRAEILLKKIITTQEDERKRIARELHDATLQDLSAALMRIDMCKLHPAEITPDRIDKVRGIVLSAWDGVINIIKNLRPTLIDDLGLTAAIKSLLDTHFGGNGVNYSLTAEGMKDKRLRPEVEITVFRIVQEAIFNIAKHARAKNILVLFRIGEQTVYVDIEDDGQGFDIQTLFHSATHTINDRRGLGLLGMKERAGLLGGKFEICSQPGIGTGIHLQIPLECPEVMHA